MQTCVYHNLRLLMDETDVGKIENLLQMTISQMETSNNTKEFCDYFKQKHSGRSVIT
jgi:flagellar motor component MotA